MPKITYVTFDGKSHTIDAAVGSTVMENAVRNQISGIEAVCAADPLTTKGNLQRRIRLPRRFSLLSFEHRTDLRSSENSGCSSPSLAN